MSESVGACFRDFLVLANYYSGTVEPYPAWLDVGSFRRSVAHRRWRLLWLLRYHELGEERADFEPAEPERRLLFVQPLFFADALLSLARLARFLLRCGRLPLSREQLERPASSVLVPDRDFQQREHLWQPEVGGTGGPARSYSLSYRRYSHLLGLLGDGQWHSRHFLPLDFAAPFVFEEEVGQGRFETVAFGSALRLRAELEHLGAALGIKLRRPESHLERLNNRPPDAHPFAGERYTCWMLHRFTWHCEVFRLPLFLVSVPQRVKAAA